MSKVTDVYVSLRGVYPQAMVIRTGEKWRWYKNLTQASYLRLTKIAKSIGRVGAMHHAAIIHRKAK